MHSRDGKLWTSCATQRWDNHCCGVDFPPSKLLDDIRMAYIWGFVSSMNYLSQHFWYTLNSCQRCNASLRKDKKCVMANWNTTPLPTTRVVSSCLTMVNWGCGWWSSITAFLLTGIAVVKKHITRLVDTLLARQNQSVRKSVRAREVCQRINLVLTPCSVTAPACSSRLLGVRFNGLCLQIPRKITHGCWYSCVSKCIQQDETILLIYLNQSQNRVALVSFSTRSFGFMGYPVS